MKKYKYLHTINSIPASYSKPDGQICYITKYYIGKLCDSLKQIRKEQGLTKKTRKSWGAEYNKKDYSYIRVYVGR